MAKAKTQKLKDWGAVRDLVREAHPGDASLELKAASQEALKGLDPDERRAFISCVCHGHDAADDATEALVESAKGKLKDVSVTIASDDADEAGGD